METRQEIYARIRRRKTIEEYLKRYFELNQPETYLDKEFKVAQCEPHKRRSLTDLFLIVRTKYKSITYPRLIQILDKICKESDVGAVHCSRVKDLVFFKGATGIGTVFTSYTASNRRSSATKSGYSVADFKAIANKSK